MIGGGRFALVRTTLLDYPGKVAAAVFLPGCHLRCPFCHNRELVLPELIGSATGFNADMQNLADLLEKRHKILGGLAVSGGEALLHPLLPEIFNLARRYGMPLKLDTAGLLPEQLGILLAQNDSPLEYVAVDLKTNLRRYGELGWKPSGGDVTELYIESLDLLDSAGIDYELRTTVVPPLVDNAILGELDQIASRAPRWIWQSYVAGNTLNPEWSAIDAPSEHRLRAIAGQMPLKSNVIVR